MSELMVFSTHLPRPSKLGRVMVIYCSGEPDEHSIDEYVDQELHRSPAPDVVCLLSLACFEDQLLSLLKNEESDLVSRFAGRLSHAYRPAIYLVVFDPKLSDFRAREVNPKEGITPNSIKASLPLLRQHAMQETFKSRDGVLHGSPRHHFAKPSGRHSEHFLRTANVLVDSAEISFIAYWLLPALSLTTKRLICDTSAIAAIGYELVRLWELCLGKSTPLPVKSFGSYEGLSAFRLRFPRSTLALISASTSGGLKAELERRGIPDAQIWTIFYLGPKPVSRNALCDLGFEKTRNTGGLALIQSYVSAQDCDLCKAGSLPITIFGDQFLTSPPSLSEVRITVNCAPEFLRTFMEEFSTRGLFSANAFDRDRNRQRRLSFNTERAFVKGGMSEKLEADLKDLLTKRLPTALRHIIYVNTPGSKALASRVLGHYESLAGKRAASRVRSLSDRSLFQNQSNPLADGAIVVVSDTLFEGRRLMNINRALRDGSGTYATLYLVAFANPENGERLKDIRSNLTQGTNGADTFSFKALRTCHFPIEPNVCSPWDEEKLLLQKRLSSTTTDADRFLRSRIRTIEAGARNGLVDDLFWKSAAGKRLQLRGNFAFFKTQKSNPVSQADVFATMETILGSMRMEQSPSNTLAREPMKIPVLSPYNFDRFNDGVIQAAILRGAMPWELNYVESDRLSLAMRDLVNAQIDNAESPNGEACLEFLLALAMGRLRVRRPDTLQIIAHAKRLSMSNLRVKFLVDTIRATSA